MSDFCAAYDLDYDIARYMSGGGHSFTEMAQELLSNLDQPVPDLDAVLLAHHLPDTKVFEIAGCHLTELCPGNPLAFSVAGQGIGAPFTALRILTSMRQTENLRDGAILILDQLSLPYPDPDTPNTHDATHAGAAHEGAVCDRGVLLCTDPAGAVLDFVDDTLVTDPTSALEALRQRFPEARIVLGRNLASRVPEPGRNLADQAPEPGRELADHTPEVRPELAGQAPEFGQEPAGQAPAVGQKPAGQAPGVGRIPVGHGPEPTWAAATDRGPGSSQADQVPEPSRGDRRPEPDRADRVLSRADRELSRARWEPGFDSSTRVAEFPPPRARLLTRNERDPLEGSRNPVPTRAKGPFARTSSGPAPEPPGPAPEFPGRAPEFPRPAPEFPGPAPETSLVAGSSYQLCTSAWAALAEHWPLDRYTVVADYDPHTSRLYQAGLRPGAVS